MKTLFRILQISSDTQMREILDLIAPDWLRPFFKDIFQELQRGKPAGPVGLLTSKPT